eukprot:641228-Alexandrium_andersonii.AAC.1
MHMQTLGSIAETQHARCMTRLCAAHAQSRQEKNHGNPDPCQNSPWCQPVQSGAGNGHGNPDPSPG